MPKNLNLSEVHSQAQGGTQHFYFPEDWEHKKMRVYTLSSEGVLSIEEHADTPVAPYNGFMLNDLPSHIYGATKPELFGIEGNGGEALDLVLGLVRSMCVLPPLCPNGDYLFDHIELVNAIVSYTEDVLKGLCAKGKRLNSYCDHGPGTARINLPIWELSAWVSGPQDIRNFFCDPFAKFRVQITKKEVDYEMYSIRNALSSAAFRRPEDHRWKGLLTWQVECHS